MLNQELILEKEAVGVQIPGGNQVALPEGSRMYVTQMLGGSLTAATDVGLVRFSREEAVRVGLVPPEERNAAAGVSPDAPLEEQVREALKTVYDPEIPVDIVNLGLVYGIEVVELEDGLFHVHVKMTLTAPGCGMGPHLMAEAEMCIAALEKVETVNVECVWEPAWNQDMISEEGRMQLGMV